jgi:hypothetical protein
LRVHPDFGLFAGPAPTTLPEALAGLGAGWSAPIPETVGLVEQADAAARSRGPRSSTSALLPGRWWPTTVGRLRARELSPSSPCRWATPTRPEMRALATLTKPGPFFSPARIELGSLRRRARSMASLVGHGRRADAARRLHRGQRRLRPSRTIGGEGYAARLLLRRRRRVSGRAARRPFLHSYADNTTAIALYQALGYRGRREVVFTILRAQ